MNNENNNLENAELNPVNLGTLNPSVPPVVNPVNQEMVMPAQSVVSETVIPPVNTVEQVPMINETLAPMPAGDIVQNNVASEINAAPSILDNGMINPIPNNDVNPIPTLDPLMNPAPQIVVPENESVGAIPPNNPEKKGMNKVLFIILIVALILGVAYGIYYFLSMNNAEESVTLSSKEYDLYSEVSENINDYATFENVDSANCALDVTGVDSNVVGTYEYTITCGENVYTSSVEVSDNRDFIVETDNVVFFKGAEVIADDFILSSTKDNVYYSFVDDTELLTNLTSTGGPYSVSILAVDNLGNELIVEANYYVVLAYLDAISDEYQSENYDASYTITDRFYIGTGNVSMGISYRYYTYQFDYDTYVSVKSEFDGGYEFDNLAGILVFDDENYTLTIEVTLTDETLDIEYGSDFPEDYSSISTYYKNNGYTISIIR